MKQIKVYPQDLTRNCDFDCIKFGMPVRTFVGYCVGEFIKKFYKKIAYYAGAGMIFLAVLSYNNWISINWRQIDEGLLSLLFSGHK